MPSRTITTPITLEGVATLEDFNAHRDDSSIHFKLAAGDNISIASDATTNTSTVSVPTDQAPVPYSTKPIQSGGVYNSIAYPEVVGSEFIDGAAPQVHPYPHSGAANQILNTHSLPPSMSLPMSIVGVYSGHLGKKVAALQVKAAALVTQAHTRLFLVPDYQGQGIPAAALVQPKEVDISGLKYFSSDPQEPVETAVVRDLYLYPNADTITAADIVGTDSSTRGKRMALGFGESPDKVMFAGEKDKKASAKFAIVYAAAGDLRKDPDTLYLGFYQYPPSSITPIKLVLDETVKGKVAALETALSNKQDKLTAGAGIVIDENNVISADVPPQHETTLPDELQHGHVYSVVVSSGTVDLSGKTVEQGATAELYIDYTAGTLVLPGWWWIDGTSSADGDHDIPPWGQDMEAGHRYVVSVRNDGRKTVANIAYDYQL